MNIIKRNGNVVPFNKEKIINAINSALIDVDKILYETDTAKDIADEIETLLMSANKDVTVEFIQNLVEDFLMKSERKDVARSYIRYRYKKEVARNYSNDFLEAISEKLKASNVQNQNANVDEYSFGGRTGEATEYLTKRYALDFCVSPMARKNHENNMIYIHDLGAYAIGSHNCMSIPFDDLLAKGFNTRQTDVRPANSINTAFQLLAVIFQLQSLQQFGGVSATHLDWTMVPYVRKSFYKHYKDGVKYLNKRELDYSFNNCMSIDEEDYQTYSPEAYEYAMDMTIKETQQAVEGMFHNLNTLQSRSGNQLK